LRGAVDGIAPLPFNPDTRSKLAIETAPNLVTRWLPDFDSPKERPELHRILKGFRPFLRAGKGI